MCDREAAGPARQSAAPTAPLQGKRARKGVFIRTSNYSRDAIDYAEMIEARIILIDGEQLARLLFDHDLGVSVSEVYRVKRIDSDYFEEE